MGIEEDVEKGLRLARRIVKRYQKRVKPWTMGDVPVKVEDLNVMLFFIDSILKNEGV